MKKFICLIMVISLTASVAQAQDVIFSAADNGGLEISYTSTTPPRGIALKCSVIAGGLIDVDAGNVTQDPCFNTNIDYAYTIYTGGGTYNIGDGHPIADPCGPGVLDPTTGVDQFSICLGVLDQSGNQAPGPSATTLVNVPIAAAGTVTILIEEDGLRGGVAGSSLTTNLPIQVDVGGAVVECVKSTAGIYARWEQKLKPKCWCYQFNCRGDINGLVDGPFPVGLGDLADLLAAVNKLDFQLPASLPTSGNSPFCADLNRLQDGPFAVGLGDLGELLKYVNKLSFQVPVCPMDDYNFWETP